MRDFRDSKIECRCANCSLRTADYFCHLSEEARQMLKPLQITHYYAKGSKLFIEGQPPDGIFILCVGRVKQSICSKEGKMIIIDIAGPGEVLGLSAAVSDSLHMATAEAVEQCRVTFIRKSDFLRLLGQNAEVGLKAVRQLSQNYRTACLQITALGLSATVADKLATLLLDWCASSVEESDGIHLKVSYTHEELAQMIGTSRETVTRLLKSFRERKLIKRKGAEFIIPNRKRLEATIGVRQRCGG